MSLLIESAVKVTVILLAAMIAARLLRRRSAALRHWVLAVAVGCAATTPLLSLVLPRSLNALPGSVSFTQAARGLSGADQNPASQDPVIQGTAVETELSVVRVRAASAVSLGARSIARGLWAAGTIVSFLILFVGLGRLRWLASRARVIDGGPWLESGEALRGAYGLSAPVLLLQSDHPSLLITWGWRRPKVLLPAAATGWTADRVRIVLAHELAHIARRDWVVQLAAEILRCVYWFNPLMWIACRQLRVDSELACDDAVLGRGIEGPEYATHLLDLARSVHPDGRPWLPAPAMAHPSSLEGRIAAMLNTTLNRRPITWFARSATLAVLLGMTVAVSGLRAQAFYSLSGTVLDPTNGVLPDTRLVLTNAASRAKYEVRSDAAGRFEFVGLPPAEYGLAASLPGFAVLTESLEITGNTERDLRLRVGSLEETITVTDRTAAPPDPSATQERENARRRALEALERAQARCAEGAASAPVGVRIGGNILPPRKLQDARPVYPEHLKAAGVGGTVTLEAVIGTDGFVRDIRNLKGPDPALEASAADAVRQWQFSTTLLNCEPIEVEMKVGMTFRLQP